MPFSLLSFSLFSFSLSLLDANLLCSLNLSGFTPIPSLFPPRTPRGLELVVSWCRENIRWLEYEATAFDHVVVYSKCRGIPPTTLLFRKHIDFVSLPNVGMCDHTYLHHILSNWHTLAKWTVFYKGFRESRCSAASIVPSRISPTLNTNTSHGLHCCPGNDGPKPREDLLFKPSFSKSEHRVVHNNVNKVPFVLSNFTSMGYWLSHTFGVKNAITLFAKGPFFCHGGYFAVTRDVIHKHSPAVYEAMRSQQRFQREEVDHFIERTWSALFSVGPLECTKQQ